MSDNRDILMFEFLCRLGTKVDALTGQVGALRRRVTRAEHQVAAATATRAVYNAAITVRLDRLEARLDRIEHCPEATGRSTPPDRPDDR